MTQQSTLNDGSRQGATEIINNQSRAETSSNKRQVYIKRSIFRLGCLAVSLGCIGTVTTMLYLAAQNRSLHESAVPGAGMQYNRESLVAMKALLNDSALQMTESTQYIAIRKDGTKRGMKWSDWSPHLQVNFMKLAIAGNKTNVLDWIATQGGGASCLVDEQREVWIARRAVVQSHAPEEGDHERDLADQVAVLRSQNNWLRHSHNVFKAVLYDDKTFLLKGGAWEFAIKNWGKSELDFVTSHFYQLANMEEVAPDWRAADALKRTVKAKLAAKPYKAKRFKRLIEYSAWSLWNPADAEVAVAVALQDGDMARLLWITSQDDWFSILSLETVNQINNTLLASDGGGQQQLGGGN